jgi:hypothetical protein
VKVKPGLVGAERLRPDLHELHISDLNVSGLNVSDLNVSGRICTS